MKIASPGFRRERQEGAPQAARHGHRHARPGAWTPISGVGPSGSPLSARPDARRDAFRFHHVSTDEVFRALGRTGRFDETTPYAPNSPYAASKAASDHLVRAWGATYGLPVIVTNCSNNYGPFQFPEKLIPVTILRALARPLLRTGYGLYLERVAHEPGPR